MGPQQVHQTVYAMLFVIDYGYGHFQSVVRSKDGVKRKAHRYPSPLALWAVRDLHGGPTPALAVDHLQPATGYGQPVGPIVRGSVPGNGPPYSIVLHTAHQHSVLSTDIHQYMAPIGLIGKSMPDAVLYERLQNQGWHHDLIHHQIPFHLDGMGKSTGLPFGLNLEVKFDKMQLIFQGYFSEFRIFQDLAHQFGELSQIIKGRLRIILKNIVPNGIQGIEDEMGAHLGP